MTSLSALQLTHCCTLLSKREQANGIRKFCRELHCQWIWLPIEGGRIDVLRNTDLAAYVVELVDIISTTTTAQPRIYFHCSAGIHRTGFFVYALLRLRGLDPQKARVELAALRAVTAEQVGDARLDVAEELIANLLLY